MDIICEYPERFKAYLLTANSSVDLLVEQAKRLNPKYVIIANEAHYITLCEALKGYPTEVKSGMNAIVEIMADENIDIVVTAMVGYAGLAPTINAIKHNKTIALANKETLVVNYCRNRSRNSILWIPSMALYGNVLWAKSIAISTS